MADEIEAEVDREAQRLARLLEKKSTQKFEDKRKSTLANYQAASGKPLSFTLHQEHLTVQDVPNWQTVQPLSSERTTSPKSLSPSSSFHSNSQISPRSSPRTLSPTGSSLNWKEKREMQERAELQRKLEEEKRRREIISEMSPSQNTDQDQVTMNNLGWREAQQMREEQERERQLQEERMKQEKLRQLQSPGNRVSVNLDWKELQRLREDQKRRELEEEERKRREKAQEVANLGVAQLRAHEESQRQQDENYRRFREEEDRKKEELTKAVLNCERCGKDVTSAPKREKGHIYCDPCSRRIAFQSQLGICAGCQKPLGLTIAKAQNKKYHPDCLVCCSCNAKLEGGFRSAFNKLWCVNCTPKP